MRSRKELEDALVTHWSENGEPRDDGGETIEYQTREILLDIRELLGRQFLGQ